MHLTRTSRFAMLMLVFLPLKHLVRAVRSEREDQVSSVTLATFMDDTLQRDRFEARRCNGLSSSMSCCARLDWPESILWSLLLAFTRFSRLLS